MNKKRGQITIIMIVGILILIAVAVTLFLVKTKTTEKLETEIEESAPLEIASFNIFVGSCLEKTAQDAIYYNFINGGFYLPQFVASYKDSEVPYYYFLGKDYHPQEKDVEEGISKYIKVHLNDCLNNFEIFNELEVDFNLEEIEPKINLNGNNFVVKLNFPLIIKKGQQKKEITSFETNFNFPLSGVMQVIDELINEQNRQPNEVMFTFLVENAVKHNYTFKLFYHDDEVIYTLNFDNILIRNKVLVVQYAIKYDWFKELDKSIDLKPIKSQTINVGQEYSQQLNYTGDEVVIKSNSEKIEINEENIIRFFPLDEDVGTNLFIFTATKGENSDFEILNLEVVKESMANSELVKEEMVDFDLNN